MLFVKVPYTPPGTSNRSEFIGFSAGHFVYIQTENREISDIFNINEKNQ